MAENTLDSGGLIYNNANTLKATAVTVTADYSGTSLKSSSYGSSVVTITAAARSKSLNIQGNDKANRIIGTSGNDTINGGAGNDTLTGGSGNDVFVYESGAGNDVITDYTAGEDTIKIASGSISSYAFSSTDASFKIGSNTLRVKNGKTSIITVVDSKNKISTYTGGLIYNGSIAKASALTVTALCGNTLAADSYGSSVVTVDASARNTAMNITGNSKSNKIVGTSGADTLNGKAGNDTLYGGSGKDLFVYETGSGNDVIADYTAGQDTIKISGEVTAYSISGSTASFKIGSNTLKVNNAKTAEILLVDENKNATLYQSGAIYNNAKLSKATAVTLTKDGKLPTDMPSATKEGYTFDGWFTKAKGGDQATSETELFAGDTLYAHFTLIPTNYILVFQCKTQSCIKFIQLLVVEEYQKYCSKNIIIIFQRIHYYIIFFFIE